MAEPKEAAALYFIFTIGHESYAVSPDHVIEVVARTEPAPVPFLPAFLDGVVGVRGEIIPVLNLVRYFQLPQEQQALHGRLVLLGVEGMRFCVWSDQIRGIEPVAQERLEPPLGTLPAALLTCTRAQFRVGEQLVYALDLPRLVAESRKQVQKT
jgi:chemotaxis signal transduction protein